jgi:hypothetical protein
MEHQLKQNIEIAVALLGSSRTDGYGNGKITHSQRNFITSTITKLLENILISPDQKTVSIIPKNQSNFNPPDES